METMITLYKDIGIVAIVAVPLFFLIKWIMEEFKGTLQRQHDERIQWAEVIIGFQKEISTNTDNAKAFHEEVKDAHRYQREEHTALMEQMREVTASLGRINGYKS